MMTRRLNRSVEREFQWRIAETPYYFADVLELKADASAEHTPDTRRIW